MNNRIPQNSLRIFLIAAALLVYLIFAPAVDSFFVSPIATPNSPIAPPISPIVAPGGGSSSPVATPEPTQAPPTSRKPTKDKDSSPPKSR